MIKEPIASARGQATDLEIQRMETRNTKNQLVELLAKNTSRPEEEIAAAIARPKYFTPQEAIDYGLIDKARGGGGSVCGLALLTFLCDDLLMGLTMCRLPTTSAGDLMICQVLVMDPKLKASAQPKDRSRGLG